MMNRLHPYVLLGTLLMASVAQAFLPPQPVSTKRWVELSTHIFVGEVRDVHYIDQTGKVITPRQAAYLVNYHDIRPCLEIKLHVVEPLMWNSGKQEKFVLFRGGVYMTSYAHRARDLQKKLSLAKQDGGKKFVYMTEIVEQKGRRTFFVESYYPEREEMSKKAEIQKAIQEVRLNPPAPTPERLPGIILDESERGK